MTLDLRLHPFQVRAIEHLHKNPHSGLFIDMGMGKTAAVLQALTPDHLPALVTAPKRVAEEVWEVERDIWRPDLSLRVLTNVGPTVQYPKQADRRAAMLRDTKGCDITVISRDQAGVMGTRAHPYKTIILDELSGFKTKGTDRWKAARRITKTARYVWGLTGTPSPNGLMDLWAQMFLLDEGARLGTTLTAYRDRYFDPGRRLPITHIVIEWILKPGAEPAIHALLDDICLSMASEDYLTLPDLSYNEVRVHLPTTAKRVYAKMEKDLVVDLGILGGAVHTAANTAVLTNRMRQITAGFLYEDQDTSRHTRLHDEKTRTLQEIIDGTGSPVLVFYQFNEEKRNLLEHIEGARSIGEPNVIKDWNAGKVPVLVAHPATAGHGLNLQAGGHTIVWASLPWSLEEWMQANKRLHRQNQKNAVMIHVLLCPGTLDRAIFTALKNKRKVQDALLDYLREDHLIL